MGLAGKVGFTVGGLVAIGALIYFFRDKLVGGSKAVGQTIGESIGGGIGAIAPSITESFKSAFWGDGGSGLGGSGISRTVSDADPSILDNFGKNGVADYDYVSQDAQGNIKYYKNGKLIGTVDSQTITQANREYSDMPNLLPTAAGMVSYGASKNIPFFAKPRPNTTVKSVTVSGGSITSVTRSISAAQQRAAISSASPSRQAAVSAAKQRAAAKSAAKKKGKKCFNSDLDMGGMEHIDYRLDSDY